MLQIHRQCQKMSLKCHWNLCFVKLSMGSRDIQLCSNQGTSVKLEFLEKKIK